jgi:hypothetical protein
LGREGRGVPLTYVKPTMLQIAAHPDFNEKWVQQRIAEDPALLGLGDLILKDAERIQPQAGRLDLLLQDVDATERYEVELQLGKTDETHIIRTIEYWDIEKKRYPQYQHTAVLIAEDITSRFLNVVSLFNGFIPLIAIQMNAVQIEDKISLVFTKVLDRMPLGLVDEDEVSEPATREFWEARANRETVAMADELLAVLKELDPELELKYNKPYIGLSKGGQATNFVIFTPAKKRLKVEVRLDQLEGYQAQLEEQGLDMMSYDANWRRYRIRLTAAELREHKDRMRELFRKAFEESRR